MVKIEKKITGYNVKKEDEPVIAPETEKERMHERVKRPDMLIGATYKVKTPQSEHALYITINDFVLNVGTEHEEHHPYEMFINSKAMNEYQWIVALTRVLSAIFRKGGDVAFIVEELKAVFDPKGGYWKKGKFIPSLVAEIGLVLETHLETIGLIKKEPVIIPEEKRMGIENAQICPKCGQKTAILMDGCLTCVECGYSKCG